MLTLTCAKHDTTCGSETAAPSDVWCEGCINESKTDAAWADEILDEIRAHVESGVVPADVPDFSALHDYLDANCYGEGIPFGDVNPDGTAADNYFDRWIAVQDIVDAAIKAGAIADPDFDVFTVIGE